MDIVSLILVREASRLVSDQALLLSWIKARILVERRYTKLVTVAERVNDLQPLELLVFNTLKLGQVPQRLRSIKLGDDPIEDYLANNVECRAIEFSSSCLMKGSSGLLFASMKDEIDSEREELGDNDSKREDIGMERVAILAPDFRRDVAQCPSNSPENGRRIRILRHVEVGHISRSIAANEDVSRLDIAVDDATMVQVLHRARDLEEMDDEEIEGLIDVHAQVA